MSALRSRRRVLAVAVSGTVVTALGILGITTAMAAEAGPIKGLGGKCVDVAGASPANGTAVQLWDCNDTGAQRWTVDGGRVKAFDKCLDVAGGSRADGAKAQLYDCNGTDAQAWTVHDATLVNTAQITTFIRNTTAQLEATPYVERYAWFSLPAVGDSVDYGLYRDATTPTEAGKAYRAAGH